MWVDFRDVYGEVCAVFDVILTEGCESHKVCATTAAFYHVGDGFLVEVWLCEYADYEDIIFDEGDRTMF